LSVDQIFSFQGKESDKKFKCTQCELECENYKQLVVHKRAAHTETIVCDICDKTFVSKVGQQIVEIKNEKFLKNYE